MNPEIRRLFQRWVIEPIRTVLSILILLYCFQASTAIKLTDAGDLPIRIAEGFRIKKTSLPGLFPRITAITFDSLGRLVVATPYDIRTLIDSDSDGVYDRFVVFAGIKTSGPITYDLNSLYFFDSGALFKITDQNGDGVADTDVQKLLEIQGVDSASGSLKRGGDGWWYLSVGYTANIDSLRLLPSSVITRKNGGALLRISPDFSAVQIYAHGFYNPVGFDFDLMGNIYLCDSGSKNSNFLPWETGSRLIKVKYGWHYGWTASKKGEIVVRPEYYFDNGGSIENLGVSVPAKPVVYLHKQFPEFFHGGVFLPVWSAGKILFFPKQKDGNTILPSEVFLESVGNSDFAPSDIAVAPDGSLVIATGGAMAKSEIYRITFTGSQQKPTDVLEKISPVLTVLNSPQPFEAWSKAKWMPIAEKLGDQSFGSVITSELYSQEQRIRAIDIKIEMSGGLTFREVRSTSRAVSPIVREKLARTLQLHPVDGVEPVLNNLIADPAPEVRLAALEALYANARQIRGPLLPVVLEHLNEKEREFVIATARLASALNEEEWKRFLAVTTNGAHSVRAIAGMATVFRYQKHSFNPELINLATGIFQKATDPLMRMDALRLIIVGLGDYPGDEPSSKISTVFETTADEREIASAFARVMFTLRPIFPGAAPMENIEFSRIFAILKDPVQKTALHFATMVTPQSPINQDLFFLCAYAMLPQTQTSYDQTKIATALATFLTKLETYPAITRQQRAEYVDLLISALIKKEPDIANVLIRSRSSIIQCLPYIGPYLDLNRQQQALNQFLELYLRGQRIQFTEPLLHWLSGFTKNPTVRGILLQNWTNALFQDEILIYLSANPVLQDKEKFFAGLSSQNPDVVMACLDGLLKLPPDSTPAAQLRIFQLLRRLVEEPELKPLRERAVRLLTLMGAIPYIQEENISDRQSIEKIYEPAFVRFANMYPALAPLIDGNADNDGIRLMNLVRFQQLPQGNAKRGLQVFEKRRCADCHNPVDQFGPDIFKYAQNISVGKFVRDVVSPNFKISRDFNGKLVFLKNGKWLPAILTFTGNDYTFLRTSPTNTIRLPSYEIMGVKKSDISFMPSGLLNNATIQEISDLYRFLKEPVY